MSFKKNFFRNLIVSAGFSYSSQAISFLSTIVTARLLSPEAYGFVGLITVFTGFLTVFSDSGISLAIIRSDLGHSYQKSVDNLALCFGVILCLITCLLSFPVSLIFNNKGLVLPMMVMSANFIFKSMTLVRMALLSKALRFSSSGAVTLYTMCINVVLTIIFAYLGAGYWSLIIPQIIANIASLLILETKIKLGYNFYPVAYLKVSFKHTRNTIGNLMGFNMVNYWARNADNLIVGKLFGVNSLGIYNRAYSLLTIPLSLINGLIGSVLYPSLSKIKNNLDEIRSEYLFILKIIVFLSYPITFLLVMFPEQLVMVLWGSKWFAVSKLIPYFGLLIFSQSLLSTVGNILVLIKKEAVLRISGWVGAGIMIAGICFGAQFSYLAIAQFYTLAFIMLVLPFNIYYVYIKTLKFGALHMARFWGPVVIVSLLIWCSCYFEIPLLKVAGLLFLIIAMVANAAPELNTIIGKLRTLKIKAQSK